MSCYAAQSVQNEILSALPADVYQHLLPSFRPVTLAAGRVIQRADATLEAIYFPITCVISLFYTMKDGNSAEIAMIGREGVVGLAFLLGMSNATNGAVTQIEGQALSIHAGLLHEEFSRAGVFQRSLLRYTQRLIEQISQIAVCNRLHSIEQRFCRWLLSCQDRTQSNVFHLTQESIAHMLGTRRESVTVTAGNLQDQGAIHYARGQIRILNRSVLQTAACECYEALNCRPGNSRRPVGSALRMRCEKAL